MANDRSWAASHLGTGLVSATPARSNWGPFSVISTRVVSALVQERRACWCFYQNLSVEDAFDISCSVHWYKPSDTGGHESRYLRYYTARAMSHLPTPAFASVISEKFDLTLATHAAQSWLTVKASVRRLQEFQNPVIIQLYQNDQHARTIWMSRRTKSPSVMVEQLIDSTAWFVCWIQILNYNASYEWFIFSITKVKMCLNSTSMCIGKLWT